MPPELIEEALKTRGIAGEKETLLISNRFLTKWREAG